MFIARGKYIQEATKYVQQGKYKASKYRGRLKAYYGLMAGK